MWENGRTKKNESVLQFYVSQLSDLHSYYCAQTMIPPARRNIQYMSYFSHLSCDSCLSRINALLRVVQKSANLHGDSLNISILSTVNNLHRECQASMLRLKQPLKGGHILDSQVNKLPIFAGFSDLFFIHLARPCDKDGFYLTLGNCSQPRQPLDATPENLFHPFEDRLAFEFADFHFSEQQSSAAAIDQALQLWAAQSAKNGFDDVPWNSAKDVYASIDEVQQGDNPWKSVHFRYQGSVPEDPPKWMTEDFELLTRNIGSVLHEQVSCTDFDGHWDYIPFMEFNYAGDRIWTNLMSADWAAKQAVRALFTFYLFLYVSSDLQDEISEDPNTHGAMFVSIVSGSDKTVASVATGHQTFHPVYVGPGNVHNTTRRAHGIGFLPCAFLPIPKGMLLQSSIINRQVRSFSL